MGSGKWEVGEDKNRKGVRARWEERGGKSEVGMEMRGRPEVGGGKREGGRIKIERGRRECEGINIERWEVGALRLKGGGRWEVLRR